MTPTDTPIKITLPDGDIIQSTHTCNLDIPWMPASMTAAHIVPGLAHTTLISARKFCDAGCKVLFNKKECRVYFNEQLMLTGHREPTSGLWTLSVNTAKKPTSHIDKYDLAMVRGTTATYLQHTINNAYIIPTKQNAVKYMHQSLFGPPIPTLLKAVNNNQLRYFPHLTKESIRKYLAPAPATAKGHTKKPRLGIRSTKPKKNKITPLPVQQMQAPPNDHALPPDCMNPPKEKDAVNHCFCFGALADAIEGTVYFDLTGKLPARSINGSSISSSYTHTARM